MKIVLGGYLACVLCGVMSPQVWSGRDTAAGFPLIEIKLKKTIEWKERLLNNAVGYDRRDIGRYRHRQQDGIMPKGRSFCLLACFFFYNDFCECLFFDPVRAEDRPVGHLPCVTRHVTTILWCMSKGYNVYGNKVHYHSMSKGYVQYGNKVHYCVSLVGGGGGTASIRASISGELYSLKKIAFWNFLKRQQFYPAVSCDDFQ
jgi:hypothetical protein